MHAGSALGLRGTPPSCQSPWWQHPSGSVEAARVKLLIIVIAVAVLYSVVADNARGSGSATISAVGVCLRGKLEQSCENPCAS